MHGSQYDTVHAIQGGGGGGGGVHLCINVGIDLGSVLAPAVFMHKLKCM